MLCKKLAAAAVGLSLLSAGIAFSAEEQKKAIANPMKLLTRLKGKWTGTASHGEGPGEETSITYKVTGGGSAVMEILFEGTEHEMITMYHQDGEDLVLTHYCHLGNQPEMRAKAPTDADKLVFEFDGGANIEPEKDMHMHDATIEFVDEDHLRTSWNLWQGGKQIATAHFDLKREK